MPSILILGLSLFASDQVAAPIDAGNPVFAMVRAEGLTVGEKTVRLPEPTFPDGLSPAEQGEALRELAGSERAVENLVRDSVTAPFLLKLRDEETGSAIIRSGDLHFVLYLDLDAIDPSNLLGEQTESGPIEAGNMRFEARRLTPEDLQGARVEPPGSQEWYVHSNGRLLDRIAVETTSRVTASRTPESVVVAARTDPRFDGNDRWSNLWRTIQRRGTSEEIGPDQPYAGGIGYAKLTRLAEYPGAVLVEVHFAFAEPRAWFDGAPILRSKFSLIAQDQIRRLRREYLRRQKSN